MQAARLDARRAAAGARRDEALARAAQLREQLGNRSPLQRGSRRHLADAIGTHERIARRCAQELEELAHEVEGLRAAGRHPDQWLARDAHSAVTWAEAARAREVRYGLAVREAEDRAVVRTPEHVEQAIGPRPASGDQRERWDEVARALERHRLKHDIDVAKHGALGSECRQTQSGSGDREYERDRQSLEASVWRLRAELGLERTVDGRVDRQLAERDVGFER